VNKTFRRFACSAIVVAVVASALATRAAVPAGHFTVESGTVLDNKTKLTWQQATSGTVTWGSIGASGTAQWYCSTLSLNGNGWRLPTEKELLTLVDFSVSFTSTMIDATAFPGEPAAAFWSNTDATGAGLSGFAWLVFFTNGEAGNDNETNAHNVRCVR
jgi:Protein of unknown function (DUF1566)